MKKILLSFLISSCFSGFAQVTAGRYITDEQTHCRVWDENYEPGDSVTWNGGCKNGFANGAGTLRWFNNRQPAALYNGQMKNGKPNGRGKYVIENYGSLDGYFREGFLHGPGKILLRNGGKMAGNFVDGEFLNLDPPYLQLLQNNIVSLKDPVDFYTGSHSPELFYYSIAPKGAIKAVLVLLPSTGESAANVISANKQLVQQCYHNNVLSVVLSINYNKSLESDTAAFNFLNTVFEAVMAKYKVPKDKFVLSGLSLGGCNALQYTEMSRNPQYKTSIQPMGVVGVDPPVDETDLYNAAKEAIALYEKRPDLISESIKPALAEDHFLLDYYHQLYGGSPAQVPERYIAGSVFCRTQADGGNAKYLVDVPVRLYADPDIVWNLKYKHRDYYHINAANLSALANFLMMNGSKTIEFIPAIGKGYRVDGTRHPHSWSIVEPADCIKWIKGLAR